MNKHIIYFSVGIASLVFSGCRQHPKENTHYVSPAVQSHHAAHAGFSINEVDNLMDPSCMMPLTAGIGDTLHYQGLVLGFCSKECKNDFFKDPKGNLRLAKLKKEPIK